jgi:hypothetical protein
MAKSIIALLLASAAAAEYNLTYLDVLWIPAPTLTLVSSDSIATTYELQCPTNLLTSTSPESSEYEGPFADCTYYPLYQALDWVTLTRSAQHRRKMLR